MAWPYLTLTLSWNKRPWTFAAMWHQVSLIVLTRHTVFFVAGNGEKYTCLFVYSSAWRGVHCVQFETGRKRGDLVAIRCHMSVKLSLLRQIKECGQTYIHPYPCVITYRKHWMAWHFWELPPTCNTAVQWFLFLWTKNRKGLYRW